jgi:hypothetical protein
MSRPSIIAAIILVLIRTALGHERNTRPMDVPYGLLVIPLILLAQGPVRQAIVCEGKYPQHLQGIAGDQQDTLYWSFTTTLLKTDMGGAVLAEVPVETHHGDLCYVDGKVYVAYSNFFNRPGADSKVHIYDADDLSLLDVRNVPEASFGAGGVGHHNGHFFIVGGLPVGYEQNYVYEYDEDFRYLRTHTIESGYTRLGIQTVCFHDGFWWFGCYTVDGKKGLLKTDEEFKLLGVYDVSPSIGILGWGDGRFLFAKHFGDPYQAKAVWARPDDEAGLVLE